MRFFQVTLGSNPIVSEEGDMDIAGAVTAALAVPAIDADTTSEDAVALIYTRFGGASTGLKVFIDDSASPTKAQVIAGLNAVIAQVRSSNKYSGVG